MQEIQQTKNLLITHCRIQSQILGYVDLFENFTQGTVSSAIHILSRNQSTKYYCKHFNEGQVETACLYYTSPFIWAGQEVISKGSTDQIIFESGLQITIILISRFLWSCKPTNQSLKWEHRPWNYKFLPLHCSYLWQHLRKNAQQATAQKLRLAVYHSFSRKLWVKLSGWYSP